jgi:hypothetical protein
MSQMAELDVVVSFFSQNHHYPGWNKKGSLGGARPFMPILIHQSHLIPFEFARETYKGDLTCEEETYFKCRLHQPYAPGDYLKQNHIAEARINARWLENIDWIKKSCAGILAVTTSKAVGRVRTCVEIRRKLKQIAANCSKLLILSFSAFVPCLSSLRQAVSDTHDGFSEVMVVDRYPAWSSR